MSGIILFVFLWRFSLGRIISFTSNQLSKAVVILFIFILLVLLFSGEKEVVVLDAFSHSVVSDSLRPLEPTSLHCPWGFSRQEYWSGLLCPSPGHLPHPGIDPRSPALAGRFFTIWATREGQTCPWLQLSLWMEKYTSEEALTGPHCSLSFMLEVGSCPGRFEKQLLKYQLWLNAFLKCWRVLFSQDVLWIPVPQVKTMALKDIWCVFITL